VGARDVAVEVRAEVALSEPLDDPAVRDPLVAEVVNRVVVDVAVPPVSLNVAYGLAAPRAGNAPSGMRGLLAFHAWAPIGEKFARP